MQDDLRSGRLLPDIEAKATAHLTSAGFAVDYAAIYRADLSPPVEGERSGLVALIAARLGRTRLIDNLILD